MVVRLNNKAYDEKKFVKNGISHTDIFFEDGSTPKKVTYLNYYLYLTSIFSLELGINWQVFGGGRKRKRRSGCPLQSK